MTQNLLKQVVVLSLFLGSVLGIITVIPLIGQLAFWILMCLSATCVMLFMIKVGLLELENTKDSVIIGALCGFTAFLGFSVFYIPIVVFLAKVFQYYPNYGVSLALTNSGLGLIILFVIFMGVLSATVNAFSGFLTFYGRVLYKNLNNNSNNKETFKLK